jgi:sugar phosphate isomerase/epimerase
MMMQRLLTALPVLATTLATFLFAPAGRAADPPPASGATHGSWASPVFGFCMQVSDAKKRTLPEQAQMLRELGFDGVGYPIWLDEDRDRNLRALDDAGLKVYLVETTVNVNPSAPPYDPRLPEAIRKLKGRPATVCVTLRGFPPGDPRGEESAIKILRQLGDLAAASGSRVSIYHHTGDWTASLLYALEIANKTNHPQVGVNFNLCHWLMVDGEKDYRPVLRKNAAKIFIVTINGAKVGTKVWTGGLILPLDEGDFDNRELLATLRDAGYRGPIGVMCYGIPGDARGHLERSMRLLKTWMAEGTNKRPPEK